MRNLLRLVIAVSSIFAAATIALAGIDDSYDWKDQKRKLKVFYDFDEANATLGDKKMKEIMDEALKNWNDVKAETGWEFEAGGDKDNHDVRIKLGKVPTRVNGAGTTGFPKAGDKNREVTKMAITFDPDYNPGWGVNDDTKKNPIGTAKHELSHVMRLDHQGGIRSETGKMKDGQGDMVKGDDGTTISQDDKDEAKKSSTAPIKTAFAPGAPGTDVNLAVFGFPAELPFSVITSDMALTIPGSAFLNDVDITLSRTSLYSMPEPFATPDGIDRIMKGVHIDVRGLFNPPVLTDELFTLTIPYEDGAEGNGFLIDIADIEYGPIIENSLQPFMYNPLTQSWESIDVFALGGSYFLDTTNDFLQMRLPSRLLYNFPNPDDVNTGTLFLSLSGTPVPEPSGIFLLASGLAAMLALRRKNQTKL